MITVNILKVVLLYLSVFILAEFLYKKEVASYITRKIVHIGCAFVSVLLPYFVDLKTVVMLGLGFFILLAYSKRKTLLNSIHNIKEDNIGALLFAPGVVLTALIFWPVNIFIFQGAVLVLGLSDGLAGLIGKRYGKNTYRIFNTKTIEGSFIFFLTTLTILSVILYINGTLILSNILFIFVASFLLTTVEAIFGKGWDNLFVPIASGVALYFIL